MSIEEDIVQAEAARSAIIAALATGADVVEYTVGGKTVKRDPNAALQAVERALRALRASSTSGTYRPNGGYSLVEFD